VPPPVELEGFAQLKLERHECAPTAAHRRLGDEPSGKRGHATVSTAVAHRGQFLVHRQHGATLALAAVPIGRQPVRKGLDIGVQLGEDFTLGVCGLNNLRLPQPVTNRVAREPGASGNSSNRQTLAIMHPPDLG
jgi:hypothetical protein